MPICAKGVNTTAMAYNAHLPHGILVYPPKIYLPTLIIVTVGPLPSHREWNVLAAQPSTDARQQRFQPDFTLRATGDSQLLKLLKWFLLFPTRTESSKSEKEQSTLLKYCNEYSIFWRLARIGLSLVLIASNFVIVELLTYRITINIHKCIHYFWQSYP